LSQAKNIAPSSKLVARVSHFRSQFALRPSLGLGHARVWRFGIWRLRNWQLLPASMLLSMLAGCGASLESGSQAEDPVARDFPIAYIERSNLLEEADDASSTRVIDLNRPEEFLPGARLYFRRNVSSSSPAIDLLQSKVCDRATVKWWVNEICDEQGMLRPVDIKDLAVNSLGNTVVFALRAAAINNSDPEPSWNIWKFDRDQDQLQPVITDQVQAQLGDEVSPFIMVDGRIVFASSIQQQGRAELLDEGRFQYQAVDESRRGLAMNLHRVNADGTGLEQISFNMSHDLDPTLLPDGRLVYSRWDNLGSRDEFNIYTANPDGSGVSIYFGRHSHRFGQPNNTRAHFIKPVWLEDDRLLVAMTPKERQGYVSDFAIIDPERFIDAEQPIEANTPGVGLEFVPNLGGRFASLTPLNDGSGRMLSTWAPCQLQDATGRAFVCSLENHANANLTLAPPRYGIWMFDRATQVLSPILVGTPTRTIIEAVVLKPSVAAQYRVDLEQSPEIDHTLAEQTLGVLEVRNVYEVAGRHTAVRTLAELIDPLQTAPTDRPVQFMRIVRGVPLPDQNVKRIDSASVGFSRTHWMREIVGYAPVHPDGSVRIAVPANVPLAIGLVNNIGERVTVRHETWLSVKPGETLSCHGCHAGSWDTSIHGRIDSRIEAVKPSTNPGAQSFAAYPNSNPSLIPSLGETMAQTYGRVVGTERPFANLFFQDVWTDPLATPVAPSTEIGRDQLPVNPLTSACLQGAAVQWSRLCRSRIHYPVHIQPLWSLSRPVFAADGVTQIGDNQCLGCHSPRDESNGLRIPAGQLDLTDGPSPAQPLQSVSYRELVAQDLVEEIRDGAVQPVLRLSLDNNGDPIPVLDADGEPVLDDMNMPVYQTESIRIPRRQSFMWARTSRMFETFTADTGTIDHREMLNAQELLLLREWVDINSQFYNDPLLTP